jgi:voltage-gated potassium channel
VIRATASRLASKHSVAWTLLRAALTSASLVTLYYVLPFGGRFSLSGYVLLPLGLLAFGVLTAYEIRAIIRSDTPWMRVVQLLATTVPFFVVVLAATYFLMSRQSPGAFSEHLGRTDALYFTVTVFSTTGFGDIVPLTHAARIVVMIQIVGDLAVLGAAARVLTGAVSRGMEQRREHRSGAKT